MAMREKGETIDDTNMKVDMNNAAWFKDHSFALLTRKDVTTMYIYST